MNSVAGLACIAADSDVQAFSITSKVMRHPFYSHRDVFGEGKRKGSLGFPLACQLGWMLDRLMEKYHPRLSEHLNELLANFGCKKGIFSGDNVAYMALKWFLTIFASVLPPPISLRIYDQFIADGHVAALRVAMLTLRDIEGEWLEIPAGDPKMLTPRLWFNVEDNGMPSDELRPFWRNTDPSIIARQAALAPPSVDEFNELRKRYVLEQCAVEEKLKE
mmetsp:Transcript_9224/g.12683  ORF Transcript_9224/g.12683 Transcript_9224/m.12683 type:complete len:219 (-) Transcript_9224:253-909(-)